MSFYEQGVVRIRYEETGSGVPVLIIAGGGLNATISFFTGGADTLISARASARAGGTVTIRRLFVPS
jgi:hypothetical protein